MEPDYSIFTYSVPSEWYAGVYADKAECRKSARSFCLLHDVPSEECWLFLHGYRGFPGELVRPAVDLYRLGYDVYVPRLPGHGTSWKDFVGTGSADWMGLARNALRDLGKRYAKVHLLGHSMGTAMVAVLSADNAAVGKAVYACPSFENTQMTLPARIVLRLLSPFIPRVNCGWHPSSRYHLHCENAEEDYLFFGREYWTWFFTRQLPQYYTLLKQGLAALAAHPGEHLLICPEKDKRISMPSLELYRRALGDEKRAVIIDNGTHCIFYDKDTTAEEEAVQAVIDFASDRFTPRSSSVGEGVNPPYVR